MAHMVETMFSVKETPWHGLGKVVKEALDSEQALKEAGLDWLVVKNAVTVNGIVVPDYIANTRSDNGKVLGIVSPRYSIVQNADAFKFTDELIGSGAVRYETAGSLNEGRKIWVMARLEQETKILGDEIEPFLCFTNTHDGTGAVKVMMTPVRVVCQNTLNLAIRGAKRTWSCRHYGNLDGRLKDAQTTLGFAKQYMASLNETAEQLQQTKVTVEDWRDIVAELFPIDEKATDRAKRNAEENRTNLFNAIYEPDVLKFHGSAWAAIQAVTDFTAHKEPQRKTDTYKEQLFNRVIMGEPLVDRVYELVAA